jgi:hypothetical protein
MNRQPFGSEGRFERAYLLGFAFGDLHTYERGRKIRVEASSTHPSQLSLVARIFSPYAREIRYPIKTPQAYGWRVVYDLDPKFSFLLDLRAPTYESLRKPWSFYKILSGLVDAEGHIGCRLKGKYVAVVLKISNSDEKLIELLVDGLISRRYRVSVQTRVEGDEMPRYQISVNGTAAVRLLKRLDLRHQEKVEARTIAIESQRNKSSAILEYAALRLRIKKERDQCVEEARVAFAKRGERESRKTAVYIELAVKAGLLRSKGVSIRAIGKSLGKSERTVYRLLRRLENAKRAQETKPASV